MKYKIIAAFFGLICVFSLCGKEKIGNQPIVLIAKDEPIDFLKQTLFYAQALGLDSTAVIRVVFTLKMQGNKDGLIIHNDIGGPFQRHQVTIWINKRQSFSTQSMVLAHEMIHAQQYISRKLVRNKSSYFSWNGKPLRNIKNIRYENRPWEIEAKNKAFELRRDYLQSQKIKSSDST